MFTLPPLPYAQDALSPRISPDTLEFHYGKHHAAYVKNLNGLIADTPMADLALEDIIMQTHGARDGADKNIFNNAAQVWNHSFFWLSMMPDGGGEPAGELAETINSDFGSIDGFKTAFVKAAGSVFGSGYVWLIEANGKTEIMTTANAELPLTSGKNALLTCDVWEHAYYLDYQNRRPDFVQTYVDHLINWEFAAANLQKSFDWSSLGTN